VVSRVGLKRLFYLGRDLAPIVNAAGLSRSRAVRMAANAQREIVDRDEAAKFRRRPIGLKNTAGQKAYDLSGGIIGFGFRRSGLRGTLVNAPAQRK
jgi:hypothetical protein